MRGFKGFIGLTLQGIGVMSLLCVAALLLLDARGLVRTGRRVADKVIERYPVVMEVVAWVPGLLEASEPSQPQPLIMVDQLGYRPGLPKLAIAKGNHHDKPFALIEVKSNKVVYTGIARSTGQPGKSTGDVTSILDFTAFDTLGTYRLRIPTTALASYEFRIGHDVHRPVAMATIESFYYQRCGIAVNNGTVWQHPPCHLKDAVFYENPTVFKEVSGGWHDAGDYGKFVATGTASVGYLLYLYNYYPTKFTDGQFNISEARNGIPDLLDEARWELAWLLKLQQPDGSVAHQVSIKKWNGNHLPHRDSDTRYIVGVSSTATASFAAVAALGARVFNTWDKPFAYRLFRAAALAWEFLKAHPESVPPGGFKNPPGMEGGYSDRRDTDERLWAAVELYRLTGNSDFHQYFLDHYQQCGFYNYNGITWQHVENLAYASYLRMTEYPANQEAQAALLTNLIGCGDRLLKQIEDNEYRYVLNNDEYWWGSNSLVLGYAFDLIQAWEATRQPKYLDGALDQLHFMLGRNTLNKVFITGMGFNPVKHPYHQFSMLLEAGKPVPGLVVGGPNSSDGLNGKPLSEFPGKCYEDIEQNYFVNEVAINYTAPLAFVAWYFTQVEHPTQ